MKLREQFKDLSNKEYDRENFFLAALAKSAILCFDYKLSEGMLSKFHKIASLFHPIMRKFTGLNLNDVEKNEVIIIYIIVQFFLYLDYQTFS